MKSDELFIGVLKGLERGLVIALILLVIFFFSLPFLEDAMHSYTNWAQQKIREFHEEDPRLVAYRKGKEDMEQERANVKYRAYLRKHPRLLHGNIIIGDNNVISVGGMEKKK